MFRMRGNTVSVKYLDQKRRAPLPGLVPEHWHKGPALDASARLESGRLEQSRSEVEAQGHLWRRRTRRRQWWIADDKRNADRFFVREPPLFIESVFAIEVSVVAGKHDHRVIQDALALEGGEDPTQTIVDGKQHLQTASDFLIGCGGLRAKWRKLVDLAKERGFPERRPERIRATRHGAANVATAVALGGDESSWLICD